MASPPLLLLIADADRAGLVAQVEQYRAMAPSTLASIAARLSPAPAGRERLAIVSTPDRVAAALALAGERLPALERLRWVSRAHGLTFTRDARPGRVAFLFPGQGSEYVGMLASVRHRFPGVAGWLAELDRAAEDMGDLPLSRLIEPAAGDVPGAVRHAITDLERGAQLGTLAGLALHEIVTSLGVRADAHVGHSNGEHPAVIAAGRVEWDRAELCRWFVKVGRAGRRHAQPATRERLIAVSAFGREPLHDLLHRERGRLFHAMDNCPNQQVIGGDAETADAAARDIVQAGGLAVPLSFSRAYHTPVFADWAAVLGGYYDELPLRAGQVPVYSCLHVAPLPDEPIACRQAMTAQWTSLVRFRATVEQLYDDGFRTFVEIGPDAKLTAFVEDSLRGRPHVAVSASSVSLGEMVQLNHLVAELFAAGCAVNPAALGQDTSASRVTAANPQRPTAPEPSTAPIAAMHVRLIADGRTSLARARAAWLTMQSDASPLAPRGYPLLGAVAFADASTLRARRILTRRDDPFVDEHAFGRRPRVEGAYPLPVMPFTSTLELVAEAALRLGGRPVREIRDARASRWLALDFGELTLETEAHRDGDQVRVRVWDGHAGARAAAFEAIGTTTRSGLPVHVPRDPEARPPRVWDVQTFYARYAFHGPGFRGLSRVTGVGPSSIDADVTTTANGGLPLTALVLDPAMLDCAGQLVAFWLLEQCGLDPTFGVFPFAVRRVTIGHAPPAAGTRVRCRGTIVKSDAMTEARFVFETADAVEIASLDGFMQRIVPLPHWLAALVFGGAELAEVVGLIDVRADGELLRGSWGIWTRTIAHLCLTPDDLDRWRRIPADIGARADWLLTKLTDGPGR